jgi:hypothetical protein
MNISEMRLAKLTSAIDSYALACGGDPDLDNEAHEEARMAVAIAIYEIIYDPTGMMCHTSWPWVSDEKGAD